MNKDKPVILISTFREPSSKGGDLTRDSVETSYVNAIISSGGNPLLVPSGVSPEDILELVTVADGLLLPGGVDVSPACYCEETHQCVTDVSEERDALEISLVKSFFEKKKPIFGICRGAQIMNVAMGGNLYQDLQIEMGTPIKHWIDPKEKIFERYGQDIHKIQIEKGSVLAGYFGVPETTVNSLHHQAVKMVADGIDIGATAPDGVIEEIELHDMNKQWFLGVQWHPEAILGNHPENKTLFEHFIEAARKSRT